MRQRFLVVPVLMVLVAACGGSEASTTDATTTTAVPTTTLAPTTTTMSPTSAATTTSTTTTLPGPLPAWVRVGVGDDGAGFGGSGDQHMLAVGVGEPGVIAAGADESWGAAVLWFLDEGGSWNSLPMPGGELYFQDVGAFGSAVVAVGFEVTEDGEEPMLWESFDGWNWLGFSGVLVGGPGDQVIYAVAEYPQGYGEPGLVAVGDDWSSGDADGVLWISPDGLEWTRIDDAALGGPGDQLFNRLVVGGPGLVAAGHEEVGGIVRPLVCVSADGRTWTRIEDEAVFADDQAVWGLVAGGPGLVAVGFDGSDGTWNAAVWISEDGYEWSFLRQDSLGGPLDQMMFSVASGKAGLTAVGSDRSRGSDQDAAVWVSADGMTWSRIPHDEGVFGGEGDQVMLDITAFGGSWIAVGADESGGDPDAAVWVSPPPG